jgi:hypothetical protein
MRFTVSPAFVRGQMRDRQLRGTDALVRLDDAAVKFSTACDVFSFGIVFYEIVNKDFP